MNQYLSCRKDCCRTGTKETCFNKLGCACHKGDEAAFNRRYKGRDARLIEKRKTR